MCTQMSDYECFQICLRRNTRIANICARNSFANASECACLSVCVCVCMHKRRERVFPSLSKSHLCPSCSIGYNSDNVKVKSAVTMHRWDLSCLPRALSPSPSRCAPQRAILPGCSHASDLTCSFVVCKDRTSEDHFSASSSSLESHLCVGRVCGRTRRKRQRETERNLECVKERHKGK